MAKRGLFFRRRRTARDAPRAGARRAGAEWAVVLCAVTQFGFALDLGFLLDGVIRRLDLLRDVRAALLQLGARGRAPAAAGFRRGLDGDRLRSTRCAGRRASTSSPHRSMTARPVPRAFTPSPSRHGARRMLDFAKSAFDAAELESATPPDGTVMHALAASATRW